MAKGQICQGSMIRVELFIMIPDPYQGKADPIRIQCVEILFDFEKKTGLNAS